MTKKAIRKIYTAKRAALTEEEKLHKWEAMFSFIKKHIKIKKGTAILSYLPLTNKNEMSTKHFNQFMVNQFESIITYPRIQGNDFAPFVATKDTPIVETNHFNLLEPNSTEMLSPAALSLVLAPLFIFDKQGYRVGYGKGMYDRFLTKVSSTCLVLGCSFFEPITSISDVDKWDKPLHIGITPTQLFNFN